MGGKERRAHSDGAQMKAVGFGKYGLKELQLVTVPKPEIKREGQVLIKLHAAAFNPVDKIRVAGGLKAFRPEPVWPALLGYDGAGVVEAVHESVTNFKAGDEVYVRLTSAAQGSCAEYCVEKQELVALKPTNTSMEEAASLPLAAITAVQALRRLGVKEGDKVFISGGAGGVGTIAIQLAKHVLKCGVVATTASPGDKTDLVKSLGADVVVNYKQDKFQNVLKDYDCGFDTTNESHLIPQILKKGGKVVTIAGSPSNAEVARVMGKPGFIVRTALYFMRNAKAMNAAKKQGVEWSYLFLQPNGKDLEELAQNVEAGHVKPVVDCVNSLDEFHKSWDVLVSGRAKGKCVVKIVSESVSQ